jgi:hypothetical protein
MVYWHASSLLLLIVVVSVVVVIIVTVENERVGIRKSVSILRTRPVVVEKSENALQVQSTRYWYTCRIHTTVGYCTVVQATPVEGFLEAKRWTE